MSVFQARTHRTPIYRDAGFPFDGVSEAKEAVYGENSTEYVYSRYGNPNVSSVEAAYRDLEGSRWAVATSSGMAAIDVALSTAAEACIPPRFLFFSELYGGTRMYINEVLKARREIPCDFVAKGSGDKYVREEYLEKLQKFKPTVVFLETISNPLLIVPEAEEVIREAHNAGAMVIVDNTFATPLLWQPLAVNADVVVHSATKYLSGHGNLTAGLVAGNNARIEHSARQYRKLTGCILSPDEAYRLETQMKTLRLRFRAQCDNAARLAAILDECTRASKVPKVSKVLYPGLESHPTHAHAQELFGEKGFGAMISFELRGGRDAVDQFFATVKEDIHYVPTLGDIASILMHPNTIFGDQYDSGLIRFSVGCEQIDTLTEVVLRGLEQVS